MSSKRLRSTSAISALRFLLLAMIWAVTIKRAHLIRNSEAIAEETLAIKQQISDASNLVYPSALVVVEQVRGQC